MPQLPSPLRLLLPLSQTLAPAPLFLHLSRRLFSSASAPRFLLPRAAGLRALAYRGQTSRHHLRRGSSTLRKKTEEMGSGAGGDTEVTFNKTWAEGRDGGKGGSMELKSQKLNPVNTICYLQILGTGMDTAIVYSCELPEIKGKFDPSKAAALGLKPGPKYRELQLGNSMQSWWPFHTSIYVS